MDLLETFILPNRSLEKMPEKGCKLHYDPCTVHMRSKRCINFLCETANCFGNWLQCLMKRRSCVGMVGILKRSNRIKFDPNVAFVKKNA